MPQWKQYSGTWPLAQQMQAVAAGTWTGLPQLYVWGKNTAGELGQNNRIARSSPVQLGSTSEWSLINSGSYSESAAAIKPNGTLWMWGRGDSGELGQNNEAYRSSPVQVGALTNWSKISIGNGISGAIKTDGTLWMWGANGEGQLGNNLGPIGADFRRVSSPVQIGSGTNWSNVICLLEGAVALKTDGTIWAWGRNDLGSVGDNTTIKRSSPVQVGALTTWSKINSNAYTVFAIKNDGTLWAWGYNPFGQLGDNTIISRSSPVQIGALTNWSNTGNGYFNSIAVKTDGTLWSWGQNSAGQLGLNDLVYRSSPTQIGAGTDWLIASLDYKFGLAIKTNGTLWSWGYNNSGELGQNNRVNSSSPVQVGSQAWSSIQAAGFHSLGLSKSTT